jgi:hypothetical protein
MAACFSRTVRASTSRGKSWRFDHEVLLKCGASVPWVEHDRATLQKLLGSG